MGLEKGKSEAKGLIQPRQLFLLIIHYKLPHIQDQYTADSNKCRNC